MRADIRDGVTPPTVVAQILPALEDIRQALPPGYLLETGGAVEDSARGQDSIKAGLPLFLLVVMTLLFLPALYAAWFGVQRDEPQLQAAQRAAS